VRNLCSLWLYIFQWTAQWHWTYWVTGLLVQGIKTKVAKKSRYSSMEYWEIVGKMKYRRLLPLKLKFKASFSKGSPCTAQIGRQYAWSNRTTVCLVKSKTFLLLSIIKKIIRHSRHSEESNQAELGG